MSIGGRMTLLKGHAGLPQATQFAADFPVPPAGKRHVITTDKFDQWAEKNGYYTTRCEQATLLINRNNLRKKINTTASSEAWRVLGNVAFSVDVQDHGKTYKIVRAEDSLQIKADRLPGQVKQFAGTKRRRIQNLLNSVDLAGLPPAMQMRISSLDREIERYIRAIDFQSVELNREYEAVRLTIQKMVEQKALAVEYADLFGEDPDEIEEEDEIEEDGDDQVEE